MGTFVPTADSGLQRHVPRRRLNVQDQRATLAAPDYRQSSAIQIP
jgi:hypothetical protein